MFATNYFKRHFNVANLTKKFLQNEKYINTTHLKRYEWNSGPDELFPTDSYTATRLKDAVKLRYDKNLHPIRPVSYYTIFKERAEKTPKLIALSE